MSRLLSRISVTGPAFKSETFIMAYTGVSRNISQDIGLASSRDLFNWKRWDTNPISPCPTGMMPN